MQGVRKAMGVFLMFFGMVTSTNAMVIFGNLRQFQESRIGVNIASELLAFLVTLGVAITQFVLGFEFCGLLKGEKDVLKQTKAKSNDKGEKILLYGIGAIAIGFIVFFFVLMLVLPNL